MSKGFHKLEMRQGIEAPDSFILVAWWQTLEDHTIVFKQSDNFTKWRAVVGHFFAHPPVVNHFRDETWRTVEILDGSSCHVRFALPKADIRGPLSYSSPPAAAGMWGAVFG